MKLSISATARDTQSFFYNRLRFEPNHFSKPFWFYHQTIHEPMALILARHAMTTGMQENDANLFWAIELLHVSSDQKCQAVHGSNHCAWLHLCSNEIDMSVPKRLHVRVDLETLQGVNNRQCLPVVVPVTKVHTLASQWICWSVDYGPWQNGKRAYSLNSYVSSSISF